MKICPRGILILILQYSSIEVDKAKNHHKCGINYMSNCIKPGAYETLLKIDFLRRKVSRVPQETIQKAWLHEKVIITGLITLMFNSKTD